MSTHNPAHTSGGTAAPPAPATTSPNAAPPLVTPAPPAAGGGLVFKIEKDIPPPGPRSSRTEVNEVIEKMEKGDSILVPVAYRTSASNYAKNKGIKLVSKIEGDAKTHVRIWRQ